MTQETKIQRLARLRAEVAELEAEVIGEITEGTLALTKALGYHGDIPVGTLVRVVEIKKGDDVGVYQCEYLDGHDWDRFGLGDIVPFSTREEARAHLIAQIDRQLDEAYGKDSE